MSIYIDINISTVKTHEQTHRCIDMNIHRCIDINISALTENNVKPNKLPGTKTYTNTSAIY